MDRDAELFQSLADPTRLRLLNILTQSGEICVCELVDALRIPQYNISRHLHILVKAGLLEGRRRGKWFTTASRRSSNRTSAACFERSPSSAMSGGTFTRTRRAPAAA